MAHLYAWLDLPPFEIDPQNLAPMDASESDSHYHMKYPHTLSSRIEIAPRHDVPSRIQARIEDACAWYYRLYYAK